MRSPAWSGVSANVSEQRNMHNCSIRNRNLFLLDAVELYLHGIDLSLQRFDARQQMLANSPQYIQIICDDVVVAETDLVNVLLFQFRLGYLMFFANVLFIDANFVLLDLAAGWFSDRVASKDCAIPQTQSKEVCGTIRFRDT